MKISKQHWAIIIFNLLVLTTFDVLFLHQQNYEFIFYVAVIVFFFFLILFTVERMKYSLPVLWGLSIWGLMHMAGGGVFINGEKLYEKILIPISSSFSILKYDQFVHMFGFGVATVLMFELIKPMMKKDLRWGALSIVVVMAGLGVGALNEIIEFIATLVSPENGVGGYLNTSLDLVSNLIGALIALIFVRARDKFKKPH